MKYTLRSMRSTLIICLVLLASMNTISQVNNDTFKQNQRRYRRVRTAYNEKFNQIVQKLNNQDLSITELEIYIRIFKTDKIIELWGKNRSEANFKLITTYPVCSLSGSVGPKREEGDGQIPEGYYYIERFNPASNFYLSLGLNYPNRSDRILGVEGKLGGDIFIHGNCVTIGCVPITDDLIKELYVYCVEAKNNGQSRIPVTIFPEKLTNRSYIILRAMHLGDVDKLNLWADLKKGYDFFEENKTLPTVSVNQNGRYLIR